MDLENTQLCPPFKVPENYFESLEDKIWAQVKVSELSKLNKAVPDTYFSSLEDKIMSQVKLDQLVKDSLPSTPSQYFDQLEEKILLKRDLEKLNELVPSDYFEALESQVFLKTQNLEALNSLPTPAHYFENLEEQIIRQVKIDGLEQPKVEETYFDSLEQMILAQAKWSDLPQPAVPNGYFDELEEEILNKTVKPTKTQFSIWRNVKVFRGAAAVLLVALGALGIYVNQQSSTTNDLASISTDAMIAYLADQPLTEEDLDFVVEDNIYSDWTSQLDDSDIADYLLENGI